MIIVITPTYRQKGNALNQKHVHGRQVLSMGHIQATIRIFWFIVRTAAFLRSFLELQPTFLECSWNFPVLSQWSFLNVVDIYLPSRYLSTLQLLSLADVNSLLFFILLHGFFRKQGRSERQLLCRNQDRGRSWRSPSLSRISEIKLRSSFLLTSTSTCWVLSLVLDHLSWSPDRLKSPTSLGGRNLERVHMVSKQEPRSLKVMGTGLPEISALWSEVGLRSQGHPGQGRQAQRRRELCSERPYLYVRKWKKNASLVGFLSVLLERRANASTLMLLTLFCCPPFPGPFLGAAPSVSTITTLG